MKMKRTEKKDDCKEQGMLRLKNYLPLKNVLFKAGASVLAAN
jgi:hypothetical protein